MPPSGVGLKRQVLLASKLPLLPIGCMLPAGNIAATLGGWTPFPSQNRRETAFAAFTRASLSLNTQAH
jgi:hypothetical protein